MYSSIARSSGFTLIELVAVIVLIGVLAVSIAPRFAGKSTFTEYALQDEIISAARFAQQRAMADQSGTNCYQLFILDDSSHDEFGPRRSADNGTTYSYFGPHAVGAGSGTALVIDPSVEVTSVSVFFDGLGNALDACPSDGGSIITSVRTISLSGAESLNVCIEPTGYAHAC